MNDAPRNAGSASRTPLLDRHLAFLALRLTLGVNIFLHAATRMPSLDGFAQGVVEGFASTFLPEALVYGFAAGVIVPGEMVVGLLLILGLFTRWALFGGALLMTALVFGTALRQEWGTLSTQMIYAAVYYGLHLFLGYNRFSLDAAWRRKRP